MKDDFAIALSPTGSSIAQGGTATTTISITATGGFSQQVSFSCSGLPKYTSCSLSPATLTPSGTSPATSALTIKTDVTTATLLQPTTPGHGGFPGETTRLAFVFGAGLFGLSLFRLRRKSGWGSAFLSLALALVLTTFAIAGCGSSGTKTPAGTYQVTVTGTAGSNIHTANYALTVQ